LCIHYKILGNMKQSNQWNLMGLTKVVYKLGKDYWKAQGILPHVGKPSMCLREWTWLCHLYSMYSLSAPPVPTSMIPHPLSLLNWTQKCDNQSINIFSFAFEHSS
jgi:hypothetical protein